MKIIGKDSPNIRGVISIVYGLPKIGKTTLACAQPRALLLDLERGAIGIKVDRIELDAHELVSPDVGAEISKYDTIVFDSLSAIDQYFSACVVREYNAANQKAPITDPSRIPYGGAKPALAAKYVAFVTWLKKIADGGKNIVLIAHQAIRTANDPLTGKDFDTCEPLLCKAGSEILLADVDIIAYMRQERSIDVDGVSTTSTNVLVHVEPESGIIAGHRLPCENKQNRNSFKFPVISAPASTTQVKKDSK